MNKDKRILANKIRTSLLVTINKELMEIREKKQLLINSKEYSDYQKKFDNFVILERDLINGPNHNNTNNISSINFFSFPSEDYQNDKNIMIQKIQISKRRNAIFQIRRKIKDFYLKQENENKKKKIYENIQKLKNFCSHLKSKEAITINHNQRNKSEIIRRKKYSLINNKNILISECNHLKSDKIQIKKETECIIKLHKMWKSKKKSLNKIESDKNTKITNFSKRVKLFFNE